MSRGYGHLVSDLCQVSAVFSHLHCQIGRTMNGYEGQVHDGLSWARQVAMTMRKKDQSSAGLEELIYSLDECRMQIATAVSLGRREKESGSD